MWLAFPEGFATARQTFVEGDIRHLFREAERVDIPDLVALEAATFEFHRIDRRHFLRLLESPSVYCLVLESGEGLLGYAVVFLRRGKARARLYSIAVDPRLRGQGIGTRLLHQLMLELAHLGQRRLSLEVRSADAAARRFYDRLGFRQMDCLPGYYEDGAEALRLVIELPEVALALGQAAAS
jgi:[ribosomal protein S18]-alanine N-acetyltransferase